MQKEVVIGGLVPEQGEVQRSECENGGPGDAEMGQGGTRMQREGRREAECHVSSAHHLVRPVCALVVLTIRFAQKVYARGSFCTRPRPVSARLLPPWHSGPHFSGFCVPIPRFVSPQGRPLLVFYTRRFIDMAPRSLFSSIDICRICSLTAWP